MRLRPGQLLQDYIQAGPYFYLGAYLFYDEVKQGPPLNGDSSTRTSPGTEETETTAAVRKEASGPLYLGTDPLRYDAKLEQKPILTFWKEHRCETRSKKMIQWN